MDPKKLTVAAEAYFTDLARIRASGGATAERSHQTPLANLLNAVGGLLKPRVFCVAELADQGAGHPDFGLFAAHQVRRGHPLEGQLPERGVVEVKSSQEDTAVDRVREQVARYRSRYGLVLVTNFREFSLVGTQGGGEATEFESYTLASCDEAFDQQLAKPRAFARKEGTRLGEYLGRALSHQATIANPKDLAWLLASYARDGLARVEASDDAASLETVRTALEDALGVRFEGAQGARFFHSSLVQTLFYGVFSAWVLWSRQERESSHPFSWREAAWQLQAPVLRALFQQLADPGRLVQLDLVDVLDWTEGALARVDRPAFFERFDEGDAVQYFYEPFLAAFDPELRKKLGVWYTPSEVVRYMVARVDRALKDDLGIAEGLGGEQVYVLDPCCGTGAFLAEVLRRIAANLQERGRGALVGADVRKAASERVFGFEIMPAPYVVAHLQVGLALQELDAPGAGGPEDQAQRPGIFLTNALTGWQRDDDKPRLPFIEFEEERDRADRVKQKEPILVVLGNPPYDGFAEMAIDEERELSTAYRQTKKGVRPKGHGLNDLYVRFFRMAERRIAEQTGRGVVCFISNYSWLDGLSFPGMRERYLDVFDAVRIDCLNGDKYKTGKLTPDGSPDPSIFSTPGDPVGIQVGTAIATLVRKTPHEPCKAVEFRHLWGQAKREGLLATAEAPLGELYETVTPVQKLGLPFTKLAASPDWFDWPSLPELFPVSFPGVTTSRDPFLVDTDLDRLRERMAAYFDKRVSHEEIRHRWPVVMKPTGRFDADAVRDALLKRGGPTADGFVRFAYRPFDTRWLYWEKDTKLLDEKRADYRPHVFEGNMWLSSAQHLRKDAKEPQACFTEHMASYHLIERGALMFPAWLRHDGHGLADLGAPANPSSPEPNLSVAAQRYCARCKIDVGDLFHHVLAVLHDPAYRHANAGALQFEWPRIPLPDWPDGGSEAADALAPLVDRGRRLAAFLADEPSAAPNLLSETTAIATPSTTDGRNMAGTDFAATAGWGHHGAAAAVMPGQGRAEERLYTPEERAALGEAVDSLGATTFDIYLNGRAFWRNVPSAVWSYRLGGYQVLKKWLSYRERKILDRPLTPDDVMQFADTARRIGSVLLECASNGPRASSRTARS